MGRVIQSLFSGRLILLCGENHSNRSKTVALALRLVVIEDLRIWLLNQVRFSQEVVELVCSHSAVAVSFNCAASIFLERVLGAYQAHQGLGKSAD
jgi:hypothetical protein